MPFNLFLGSINEASIATPLDPFSPGIRVVALIAIWVPVLLVRTRQTLIAAILLSALFPLLPIHAGPARPGHRPTPLLAAPRRGST